MTPAEWSRNWHQKTRSVTTFNDWFRRRPGPETRADRSARFDEVVGLIEQNGMHFCKHGEPPPATGARCLIGVAFWSRYDMLTLDDVSEFLRDRSETDDPMRPRVAFDVFDFGGEEMSEEILPSFIPSRPQEPILQTPVVGFWENGDLTWYGSGYGARVFVDDLLKRE